MAFVTGLDSYILVVSDEVGVVGGVHTLSAIQEAANLSTSDVVTLSLSWHYSTVQYDGVSHPLLPNLRIEAESGKRVEADIQLTGLTLTDARAGSRITTRPNLPDLEVSASGTAGLAASLTKRLPTLSLSANTGARSRNMTLPDLGVSLTMLGSNAARMDRALPGLTISATGSTPILATLVKDLPALTMSITSQALITGAATLDRKLPPLRGIGTAIAGATITLDGLLPPLTITLDAGMYGDSLSLDAYLPVPVAGGITWGLPSSGGFLRNESRYTDYVLRHIR